LGSGSTISTDAAPAATNNTVSFNRVVSSPLQSASDMQNQAVTPLSNSPVAGSTGSAPDSSSASSPQSIATSVSPQKSIATPVQLSADADAAGQAVAGTGAPQSSASVQAMTAPAQTVDASVLQHGNDLKVLLTVLTAEVTHPLLGIMPHTQEFHS